MPGRTELTGTELSGTKVVAASRDEIDRMIVPIVMAFSADAFVRWFLPDPWQFMTYFSRLAQIHAGTVVEHGAAWRTADFRGAALWYPPGIHPDRAALGALIREALDDRWFEKTSPIFERMGTFAPAGPHWYLRQIGVDPALQRRRYGSALIETVLRECDATGVPAYLESSSPRNRALYERHGFVAIGEIREGESPPIWPMLRPPGTGRD